MNLESTTGSLFFEARKIEKHVSFAVEPLAASAKDDSMQEKMFQISVKMSNTFDHILFWLLRFSNRILSFMIASFIAIYWLTGLFFAFIYPDYEKYRNC